MKRRSFLKGATAAVAVTTIPFTLGRIKDKDRIVEIDTEDGWKQIEMSLLKQGDVFRVRENGVTVMPAAKAGGSPWIPLRAMTPEVSVPFRFLCYPRRSMGYSNL